ncbi:autotransporter domain-containing protein, partial [Escherichia coli]
VAARYTLIEQDGYTERGVSTPLTVAGLKDRSTSILAGIKANHRLTPKLTLTGSLGVEQDVEHKVSRFAATGLAGLTSESFNSDIKRTRPVASAGAF